MATADVLVMSNSAFSISAALLNPNAFNVFFPGAQLHQSRVEMSHWHTPLDRNGTLPSAALQALKRRVGTPGPLMAALAVRRWTYSGGRCHFEAWQWQAQHLRPNLHSGLTPSGSYG